MVSPHIVKRVFGSDHRFPITASILTGGILLLVSDTVARIIISTVILIVRIITSFMSTPVFLSFNRRYK